MRGLEKWIFGVTPSGHVAAREPERLGVGDPVRVVAVVVQDVPDHRPADTPGQPQGVAERERPVVVLDHDARAGRVGEQPEAGLEAVQPRVEPAGGAADVEDHDRLGSEPHPVHDLGLDLELLDGQPLDARVLRVQDRVLARVGAEADAELVRTGADRGEPLRAAGRLVAEPRQVRVARVGGERRRHPVHADVLRVEVVQDRLEHVQGDAQIRLGLVAARVVRRESTAAQHLDREPEPHGPGDTRHGSGGAPGSAQALRKRERRVWTRRNRW